ncbi:dienelactone hydrolase family protein [Jatrophihabitans sp. DSM 45814]
MHLDSGVSISGKDFPRAVCAGRTLPVRVPSLVKVGPRAIIVAANRSRRVDHLTSSWDGGRARTAAEECLGHRSAFVDAKRIAVWGYCTGATLSLLAAELSDRVAAPVLFFPSQPTFHELTPARPVHAVDVLWAM